MKALIQSLTISTAVYGMIFILIARLAFGSELTPNESASETPLPECYQTVFNMEEEEYIDDIPFDTQAIAEQVIFNQSLSVEFPMGDEAYIDDIPFSTEKVALKTMDNNAKAY